MVGSPFTLEEVHKALSKIKLNKAAEFDRVYLEFIKYAGFRVHEWSEKFYSDLLDTKNIPKQFKRPKVIALLKPEKLGIEAVDYRSTSLLRIPYKVLEKLKFILEKI